MGRGNRLLQPAGCLRPVKQKSLPQTGEGIFLSGLFRWSESGGAALVRACACDFLVLLAGGATDADGPGEVAVPVNGDAACCG